MTSQYHLGTEMRAVQLGNRFRVNKDYVKIGLSFVPGTARPAVPGETMNPVQEPVRVYEEGNELQDADYEVHIGSDGCILKPGILYYLVALHPVGESIERFDSRCLSKNAINYHFYEISLGELWVAITVPYTMCLPSNLTIGHVMLDDGEFSD